MIIEADKNYVSVIADLAILLWDILHPVASGAVQG